MMRNPSLRDKTNYVRTKGTLRQVEGQWVFRGEPGTKIMELSNKSRIFLVELIYDLLIGKQDET